MQRIDIERPPTDCSRCPDSLHPEIARLGPLAGPANLLWYVWPRMATRDVWEAQQERIRQAIHRFDGKKLCAISVDETSLPEKIDRDLWDKVVLLPNDAKQREMPGWRWLINEVQSEPGFTVWLHAKGVWRGTPEPHLRQWWVLAYETLLDTELLRNKLQKSVIAGVFRRNEFAENIGVPWHFSGTFYAFRNDWVFSRNWLPTDRTEHDGWYAEAWPALIAARELSTCLRFDGSPDLYQAHNWRPATDCPIGVTVPCP